MVEINLLTLMMYIKIIKSLRNSLYSINLPLNLYWILKNLSSFKKDNAKIAVLGINSENS